MKNLFHPLTFKSSSQGHVYPFPSTQRTGEGMVLIANPLHCECCGAQITDLPSGRSPWQVETRKLQETGM
ncbi:hypothetical protein CEXT_598191 [Caerostris extrusa]|uniref:ISL3 family transposase n=1 Tax=Caerostris extrusa TaxID=172846 RepID=A0AAV4SNR8_CAEEX|nr:hypothetical protein CEXT_598191 [Caerostris extrusa]